MKYLLLMLIIVTALSSCGKLKVEVDDIEIETKIGPDFENAIRVCNEIYGANNEQSEACFKDYRDYFKFRVELNFGEIQNFCQAQFTNELDVSNCKIDLLKFLLNLQES